MINKIILAFTLFFTLTSSYAQANLNDYKYVIVPNKYDFLKEADKYQLNSLTKFLFEKEGFTVIMQEDNYPKDMQNNRCLSLNSNVISSSGMFKTKLQVVLKDCNNNVVFESKVGETREKDYAKAHQLALRDAFTSFNEVNYSYQPSETAIALEEATSSTTEDEVEKLKEEIKELKEESAQAQKVPVVLVETPDVVSQQEDKVVTEEPVKEPTVTSNLLYAQAIDNGFQLVDSTPKVVYKIQRTSLANVYLIEGRNAILYKNGDDWILEYYEDNVLKKEQLPVKF